MLLFGIIGERMVSVLRGSGFRASEGSSGRGHYYPGCLRVDEVIPTGGRSLDREWMFYGLMYGEHASSPPRSWPFDRALVALLEAVESSVDWQVWWKSSNRRPLELWIDLLIARDLEKRVATGEVSSVPRVRRSGAAVRVDCAVDVEVARDGTTEQQREAALTFLADVMVSLSPASPPPMPEIPPASVLEKDPFMSRRRSKRPRRTGEP